MKKTIIKLTFVSLVAVFSFSCSKKIDDAYANPNTFVRVPPEELLPQIVSAMAANYGGHGPLHDFRYIGQYVQNWQFMNTLSPYDRMGYINSAADIGQSMWRAHYYDIGQNNMMMIQWAMEEKKWDYAGAGKAVFAWSWLTLADVYGEVILKEAFRRDQLTFSYDKQEEVYAYVKQLSYEALELLSRTGDNTGQLAKGDAFFYNGDINKWKMFVYGTLARVHHRYSNKPEYNADSVIFYASRAMSTNDQNAMVKFQANPSVSATNNFFGPLRGNLAGTATTNPTAIRQGAYAVNLVNGLNPSFTTPEGDPRAYYLFRLNPNGTFRGLTPNKGNTGITVANDRPQNFYGGLSSSNVGSNDSARFIFRNEAPVPVMTASEMKFLIAEAAFRKGNKQQALDAYKQGIELHFDLLTSTYNTNIPANWQITQQNKTAYLSNPNIVPTSASNLTMSKIMMQKYIAMWGHGVIETWVDMRRFHYTDIYPGESTQVYEGFTPPTGTDMFPDNLQGNFANNPNKYVYRIRPRFNSEYVWNINELERIGATTLFYHTKPVWFAE